MHNARPTRSRDSPPPGRFRFEPFEFDSASGLLYEGDEEILLPPRVAQVLQCLLDNAGQLVTKDELLEDAWQDVSVTDSSISYTVSILRQLLGDDAGSPTYVETLRGRGYRFVAAVERLDADGARVGDVRARASQDEEHVDKDGAHVDEDGTGADQGGARVATPDAQSTSASASTGAPGASLTPGDKLGSYEILDVVGAGATGTVFRARDDALERDVAIKLLADDLANDPDRLARLEREAKLLAALSHPNIATIHALEEAHGRRIPVLEFVDGETLDERIRSRPPTAVEALRIARDIASALEAAHERGIIHRDLKPANVKLTPQGQVKVLDFGLAKRLEVEILGEQIGASPTTSLTVRGRRGSIVGTAAYMSPEQARGLEVDKRADIWSFGCVLYELLTGGSRPFGGDSIADTLASVVGDDPDWTALPAETPPTLRSLLRRCLRKDPNDRLRDIGDARIEIDDALAAPKGELEPQPAKTGRPVPRGVVVAALLVLVFLLGAAADRLVVDHDVGEAPSSSSSVPSAFTFDAPEGLRVGQLQVSPDGEQIVFIGSDDGGSQLYRRPVGQLDIQPIPGTEGVRNRPFFSPSGDRLGFFTDDDLKWVPFPGGDEPHMVAADIRGRTEAMSASWGDDDVIVFGHFYGALSSVPADGNTLPEPLTTLDDGSDVAHLLPQHVPGTSLLLFTARRGGFQHAIELIDLDNPDNRRTVIDDARNGHLLHANRLVFERAGNLYCVTFDAETGSTRGRPELVADDVWRGLDGAMPAPVAAAAGTLAWMGQDQTYERHTIGRWHPDKGLGRLPGSDPLSAGDRAFTTLRLSPTGERFLLVERLGVLDGKLLTSPVSQFVPTLIPTNGNPYLAIWQPDGGITYAARERGRPELVVYSAPPGGLHDPTQHRELFVTSGVVFPISWDSTGRYLVYNEFVPLDAWKIYSYDVDEERSFQPRATPGSRVASGDLSPNGLWLAHHGRREGRIPAVYIEPFPDGQAPQVSVGDHSGTPRWATVDGDLYLYYVTEGNLGRVGVELTPEEVHLSEPEAVGILPDPKLADSRATGYMLNRHGLPVFNVRDDGTIFVLLRERGEQRSISVSVGLPNTVVQ